MPRLKTSAVEVNGTLLPRRTLFDDVAIELPVLRPDAHRVNRVRALQIAVWRTSVPEQTPPLQGSRCVDCSLLLWW